jgi:hypothetical protein
MTITRVDHLPELDDPILQELRRRVQQTKPHQPRPGDPDYLTPEQIAWIRAGQEETDA